MYIQYFNFSFLVYICTIISLCNHMPQFKNTVRPVFMLTHMGKFLLKLSICDTYVHCAFVGFLCYKVLIFCLCGLFGGNSSLILTTFPYNSKSAIQGGFQLLLKLGINYLYAYCIFVEYLRYKVLIFCFLGAFDGNSFLILTTLLYNINSAVQWGCQLLIKLYITYLYVY